MKKLIVMMVALALFLTSCSEEPKKPVVISVDLWIGHAPIFYAHAEGWLEEAQIQMLETESIGESVKQYYSGAADIITATAYEYYHVKKNDPGFTSILVHDRSYGGDVIVANRTLEELQGSHEKINLYLEPNTVNEEMWDYLVKFEKIPKERFKLMPRSQDEMSRLKNEDKMAPTVIITFNPYDLPLLQNGFKQIASSKDDRYLIIDGVHGNKKMLEKHREQMKQLHAAMERAVEVYKKDPKAFYAKVKPYLKNPSYEEFETMCKNIEWILPEPSAEITMHLKANNYSTEDWIR